MNRIWRKILIIIYQIAVAKKIINKKICKINNNFNNMNNNNMMMTI